MANEDIESIDSGPVLGPPRLTRLEPEDDAEVLRISETEERPIAQVLRRIVREHLRGEAA